MPYDLVVIGASWGGLEAVSQILDGLPDDFAAPIALVQHRSSEESRLASLLSRHTMWPVCEADDKEGWSPGKVFVAPPGYHLLIESGSFALSTDAPVRFSRPSIDVLFESAADDLHERVVGVILTGSNEDGAIGLARIKARGGYAIVQDPATAVRRDMPDAAIALADVDVVLPIDEIAGHLVELCGTGRAAAERSEGGR